MYELTNNSSNKMLPLVRIEPETSDCKFDTLLSELTRHVLKIECYECKTVNEINGICKLSSVDAPRHFLDLDDSPRINTA